MLSSILIFGSTLIGIRVVVAICGPLSPIVYVGSNLLLVLAAIVSILGVPIISLFFKGGNWLVFIWGVSGAFIYNVFVSRVFS